MVLQRLICSVESQKRWAQSCKRFCRPRTRYKISRVSSPARSKQEENKNDLSDRSGAAATRGHKKKKLTVDGREFEIGRAHV